MTYKQAVRLLHIPKTAGTTFASALVRVYGRANRFAFTGDAQKDRERFFALDPTTRQSIRFFMGHSMYETGLHEADTAHIFTVLREPVGRVKSFIQHVAAGKSRYLRDYINSDTFSIDDFLESGNNELSNLQTKMLINQDRSGSEKRIAELGPDAAFELATSRLIYGMAAFALQEDFDAGWVAIWKAIGKKPPLYAVLNKNKMTAKLDFTNDQIDRIRELNQLDILLYQAAKEEFKRRRASGRIPENEVAAFQRRQASYGKVFSWGWNMARDIIKRPAN